MERFNSERPNQGWQPPHERAAEFDVAAKPEVPSPTLKPETEKGDKKTKKKKRQQAGDSQLTGETFGKPKTEARERKQPLDKVPPLLGEGVIWQSDSSFKKPEKADKTEKGQEADEATDEGRPSAELGDASRLPEKPLTPEEAFHIQRELQTEEAIRRLREGGSDGSAETPKAAKSDDHVESGEVESGSEGQHEGLQDTENAAESQSSRTRDSEPAPRYQQLPEMQHLGIDEQGEVPKEPERERAGSDDAGFESAYIPLSENEPTDHASSEKAPDVPPPVLPPDPEMFAYQRQFWESVPSESAAEPVREAPAAVPVQNPKKYESDTPPGLQRSTADVSRAAWTGVLAGWWLGRRGKRKAVEQAHQQGRHEGRREGLNEANRTLEAQPLHDYPSAETGRPVITPLHVETHAPEKPRTAETAAKVAASAVVLERLRPSKEVPPAAKAAAKRAAERVVAAPELKPQAKEVHVEQKMQKRELLKVAKSIKIEGVSVKDIYEAKRIDEQGLRAVVGAYLRGGNVREKLSREITAKEMSFERDPMFRHNRRNGEMMDRAGAVLSKSGEKAGRTLQKGMDVARDLAGERGAKLAASTKDATHRAGMSIASGAKQAQHELIDNSSSVEWVGITAVVVVWSAILIIVLW